MSKRFTFVRRASLHGLAANKSVEAELKRADKVFASGDVPESVWIVANAALADEAQKLAFMSRRPYVECQREVLRQKPWLRLGVTGFRRDKYYPEINFIEEDQNNDDAA